MLHQELTSKQLKKVGYGRQEPPSTAKTRQYLQKLSRELEKESKDEFLIEQMQPSLLPKESQNLIYKLTYGLIVWLILIPMAVFLISVKGAGVVVLTVALLGGLLEILRRGVRGGGMMAGLDHIEPIESFEFSLSRLTGKEFLKELFNGLLGGIIVGAIVGPIVWQFLDIANGIIIGLTSGAVIGLSSRIIVGLIESMKQDILTHTRPNEGILKSRRNALILTLIAILIAWSFSLILNPFLSLWLDENLAEKIVSLFQVLLIWGVFNYAGGHACIQHFSLRLILWATGQIPWNYSRFLNYCTTRLIIQRVGGRYRFIHKRLQEHFAAMPLEG